MNHPTREEWMSYLYDELNASERANLKTHLRGCAECAAKVSDWRAARTNLDAWQLRSRRTELPATLARSALNLPVLKWAAAAAIVLGAGFGLGRLTSATAEVERVRAAIEPEIRQQLRQEFAQVHAREAGLLRDELDRAASDILAASEEQTKELLADYAGALETKRAGDNEAIYAALDQLDSQRVADCVALKQELDTVAVLTDAGLRHTQQQLVQLADATPPASFPVTPQK